MESQEIAETRLMAEIDALRAQYPDTQDLYREVCVILFFRHGITPTANRLYQLVRKGSMSAPAEALNRFWENLREKSRIRIEHPDLPESLRDAAGELVGVLWQRAQAQAQIALKDIQDDAQTQIQASSIKAEEAMEKLRSSEESLAAVRQELQTLHQQLVEHQASLARAQGEVEILQRQVDTGVEQRRELQENLNAAQQRFTHELEQQRVISAAAEERHAGETRRLLTEVDRERTSVSKAQKDLDGTRRTLVEQTEQYHDQLAEQQSRAQLLGQRNAELEATLVEVRGQRDQLLSEVGSLRLKLESKPAARKPRSKPITDKE